ncbi:MAG: transaldolase [Candidatus Manganitrophus sp.]|nr:transaldolase [Candidatus Manganitrophus sp.]
MKKNPIKELQKQGQSLWLDHLNRPLITSGALQRLIDEGLTGLTSNPTIFEKAIGESADYDEEIRRLVSERKEVSEIVDTLTIKDIQMAADLFRPVYERTNGQDGFVSIELDPALAHQTEATIAAAKALHPRLDRPNVMIKVPATEEGIPAIEALTAEGISINITLLFSLERYAQVASAYIAGIKSRLQQGRPVASIRSVASVFVSRIDTAVDRLLERAFWRPGSRRSGRRSRPSSARPESPTPR